MAHTSVSVAPAAAADLRLFAAQLGAHARRRVTMTEALTVACHIATKHLAADAPEALARVAATADPDGEES